MKADRKKPNINQATAVLSAFYFLECIFMILPGLSGFAAIFPSFLFSLFPVWHQYIKIQMSFEGQVQPSQSSPGLLQPLTACYERHQEEKLQSCDNARFPESG